MIYDGAGVIKEAVGAREVEILLHANATEHRRGNGNTQRGKVIMRPGGRPMSTMV